MPVRFVLEDESIAVFHVSGKLKLDEFKYIQQQCEKVIEQNGHVKVLAITANFEGWEKAEGWGDWTFEDRTDANIDKIALVGEKKWEDLVYAFTGKGLRPVPIEYFNSDKEDAARKWLVT